MVLNCQYCNKPYKTERGKEKHERELCPQKPETFEGNASSKVHSSLADSISLDLGESEEEEIEETLGTEAETYRPPAPFYRRFWYWLTNLFRRGIK